MLLKPVIVLRHLCWNVKKVDSGQSRELLQYAANPQNDSFIVLHGANGYQQARNNVRKKVFIDQAPRLNGQVHTCATWSR